MRGQGERDRRKERGRGEREYENEYEHGRTQNLRVIPHCLPFSSLMLSIELRTLHMIGKCSTTKVWC